MTKEQILDHFKDINHAYNECTRYDDLKRMLDELDDVADLLVLTKIREKFIEQCNDLKRMLDEFEEEHATICDEDGRRFKVVIDGLLYYVDDPKIKTIHKKTGEVVIGGFYRDGQRKGD